MCTKKDRSALLGKKKPQQLYRYGVSVCVCVRFRVSCTIFFKYFSSECAREREIENFAFLIHAISVDRTIWICFSFHFFFFSSSCLLVASVAHSVRSLIKLHNYTIIREFWLFIFIIRPTDQPTNQWWIDGPVMDAKLNRIPIVYNILTFAFEIEKNGACTFVHPESSNFGIEINMKI